jgi:hypothetical protein
VREYTALSLGLRREKHFQCGAFNSFDSEVSMFDQKRDESDPKNESKNESSSVSLTAEELRAVSGGKGSGLPPDTNDGSDPPIYKPKGTIQKP